MRTYNTILVAVDTSDEASDVLEIAQQEAQHHNAQLHIMTVIRPLNYTYTGFESAGISQAMVNFEVDATASAKESLQKLASETGTDNSHLHVTLGRPAEEIKSTAEQLKADLIVVGSHGRHGLGLMLGSTSNGVLHGSPCDVLTVRVGNSK